MSSYLYTTQAELRRAFKLNHPDLNFKKSHNYGTHAPDYCCDTRCAFVDWIDHLERNGLISESLAFKATL